MVEGLETNSERGEQRDRDLQREGWRQREVRRERETETVEG